MEFKSIQLVVQVREFNDVLPTVDTIRPPTMGTARQDLSPEFSKTLRSSQ